MGKIRELPRKRNACNGRLDKVAETNKIYCDREEAGKDRDKILGIGTLIVRRRGLGGNKDNLEEREEECAGKGGIDNF